MHDWNVGIRTFVPGYNPGPEIERRNFEASPLHFVKGWRSPVLLVHGDDDRNVSFSETVALAEALRKQGVALETLVLPDEIHSFLRYDSWLRVFTASADFLDRHVKEKSLPAPGDGDMVSWCDRLRRCLHCCALARTTDSCQRRTNARSNAAASSPKASTNGRW